MRQERLFAIGAAAFLLAALITSPVRADVYYQCPANIRTAHGSINVRNPAASSDPGCRHPDSPTFFDTCKPLIDPITGQPSGETTNPNVVCRSITCGDGHIMMADGTETYIFGFDDVTGVPESLIMTRAMPTPPSMNALPLGGAEFSAPTMVVKEGQDLYLTLTNVGMRGRPDLFDAHTVHYHGFPNAAPVFDGEPMASFGIGMGSSLTYYYKNQLPGTYMWHCHVEAAEHMQMGMLGNLYVLPKQDGTGKNYQGHVFTKFAYDDCPTPTDPMCGSTGYNVMYFLQETAFDPRFHHSDETYQKLDFAHMDDTYLMLNGRGYPDTVNPADIVNGTGNPSQPIPAIPMTVTGDVKTPVAIHQGDKVLIRLSSLSTVDLYSVTLLGIPMRVVGQGAQLLRGPSGFNTSYAAGPITLGGGESADLLLDTTAVAPGTYFLYTTNLNHLSNDAEDFGGMMTEIVVN